MSVKVDEKVLEALSQGKIVVIMGKSDSNVRIDGPKEKVVVIVRE